MIDFHVHSTASDGTRTPSELAKAGKGFLAMAITDHDNCDGVEEFLTASKGDGIRLGGVELSVEPGEGYKIFHMIGLGIDWRNEDLKRFLKRVLEGRNARNKKIMARFAEIGIEIPPDEIMGYAHGDVLARPHYAAWLADHGYAADKKSAFEKYLTPDSPTETKCYVTRYHPDPGEAIDVIHSAGGAAIMAHPKYWTHDESMLINGLRRLKDRGLDAVEAIYEANTPDEAVLYVRATNAVGLCVSAGSDYHGANKPSISLGMKVREEAKLVENLLKRIRNI